MNAFSFMISNGSIKNETDLLADGCFLNYNDVACARDVFEACIAVVTIILCLVKLFRLHQAKHELWNQYVIFYVAVTELILLTANWMYIHSAYADIVAELLKLMQFLVICRFYCEVASRISKREYLYSRVMLPGLIFTFLYFCILMIVGVWEMTKKENKCLGIEWVQLSISEVVLGIIFIVTGSYITKKNCSLQTDVENKRDVRINIWSVVLSFEFSAIVSMTYDIIMLSGIGEENKCRGIFVHNKAAFTAMHLFVKISKWLLPIWAMVAIFKPEYFVFADEEDEEDEVPPIVRRSIGGIFTSEFRPRGRSFNYKHLRDPTNETERNLAFGAAARKDVSPRKKRKRSRLSEGSSGSSVAAVSPCQKDVEDVNENTDKHLQPNVVIANSDIHKELRNVAE